MVLRAQFDQCVFVSYRAAGPQLLVVVGPSSRHALPTRSWVQEGWAEPAAIRFKTRGLAWMLLQNGVQTRRGAVEDDDNDDGEESVANDDDDDDDGDGDDYDYGDNGDDDDDADGGIPADCFPALQSNICNM